METPENRSYMGAAEEGKRERASRNGQHFRIPYSPDLRYTAFFVIFPRN